MRSYKEHPYALREGCRIPTSSIENDFPGTMLGKCSRDMERWDNHRSDSPNVGMLSLTSWIKSGGSKRPLIEHQIRDMWCAFKILEGMCFFGREDPSLF